MYGINCARDNIPSVVCFAIGIKFLPPNYDNQKRLGRSVIEATLAGLIKGATKMGEVKWLQILFATVLSINFGH
jgi:hypothetical protein